MSQYTYYPPPPQNQPNGHQLPWQVFTAGAPLSHQQPVAYLYGQVAAPADTQEPAATQSEELPEADGVTGLQLQELLEAAIRIKPWEQSRGHVTKAWGQITDFMHSRGSFRGYNKEKIRNQVNQMLNFHQVRY